MSGKLADPAVVVHGALADLALLSRGDAVVGTSISVFSRLAWFLVYGYQGKVPPYVNLDTTLCCNFATGPCHTWNRRCGGQPKRLLGSQETWERCRPVKTLDRERFIKRLRGPKGRPFDDEDVQHVRTEMCVWSERGDTTVSLKQRGAANVTD